MIVFAVALLLWLLPALIFIAVAMVALIGAMAARTIRGMTYSSSIARSGAAGAVRDSEVEHAVATG